MNFKATDFAFMKLLRSKPQAKAKKVASTGSQIDSKEEEVEKAPVASHTVGEPSFYRGDVERYLKRFEAILDSNQ